jgi:3'-phosphoadenosine 5'-phosphosulfate sulfotransferase (PAPS reductase)/FAD synthetase
MSVGEAFRNKAKGWADEIPVYCAHSDIIDIIEVIPNPRNPNVHKDAQIDLLARIIKAQGWRNPIVISKLSGFITKGHGRLLAAQKLGAKHVPVDYQDYESPAMEWADVLADNKIAELANPDKNLVKEILDEVRGLIDMDLTGYAGVQVDKLLQDIARHNNKFQPGKSFDSRNIDFVEDEKEALAVPEADKHYFEGKKNVAVVFSGGIDSTFSLYWAKVNFKDLKIVGIFSDPGVELPGAALHAYQVCMHLGVEFALVKPKSDMFIECVKKGYWPSTIYPWCQVDFVYKPINEWIKGNLAPEDTVVMYGSKGDQATRLTKKTKTHCFSKDMQPYTYYHPGFDIARDTTLSILKKAGVPLWWGYEKGFARTACWMCPGMKGEQALAVKENFPGLAKFIEVMEKHLGTKLDPLRDKCFCDLVEVGKRQVARKAKGEAPEEEIIQEAHTDFLDAVNGDTPSAEGASGNS